MLPCRKLPLARGLLACVSLAVHAAAFQAAGPGDGFRPIRFGDPEQSYEVPFFADADHDAAITSPDAVLGQPLGTRPAHASEILQCFRAWQAESDRVQLEVIGRTHEGRELARVVVTSPENLEHLDAWLADLGRLADPRHLSVEEGQRIVERARPVAWLGYSIHGDEISGSDASLALAHHLIAGRSEAVRSLLQDLIVVIDPCMNPDGRERSLGMIEQAAGVVPNLDHASMHRGRWPYGRGNHYLFDMNRDWMAGTQPETRARWRAALRFHPQLFVDAHEMGAEDTYLFYPQAQPLNPYLPETLPGWQKTFGDEQAAAFDLHQWAYYTREWADAWAPFYSDAWGSLNGAIGILYEQAGIGGAPIVRASGKEITYRETVHHQVVSSWSNLRSLQRHRASVLVDYLAHRRANVAPDGPGNDRMYVLVPGRNDARERALLDLLLAQDVEVSQCREHFEAVDVLDTLGRQKDVLDVPPGSYVIPARQPQAPLVKAYLTFDIRIDRETLQEEREELERGWESKLYDNTAWSLSHAFDVEAYWCQAREVEAEPLKRLEPRRGSVAESPVSGPVVGWVVDGASDASLRFVALALELGVAVHLSDRTFESAGRVFCRGSLLVRRNENEDDVAGRVTEAAEAAGVTAYALHSLRGTDEEPDLGGGHFQLLERPRVAILANAPVAPDTFGHLWHYLDRGLGVPVSQLDAQRLAGYDLRRFNVLVLPPVYGGLESVLGESAEEIQAWIHGGGTVIASGNAASALTSQALGWSEVVLRHDALEDLDDYEFAAERERAALRVEIDEARIWGDESTPSPDAEAGAAGDESTDPPEKQGDDALRPEGDPDAGRQDEWMRRFAPGGAFVRGLVHPEAWITSGSSGAEMPLFVTGEHALLAREPVQAALRLARPDELRLSGLVWPEARERLGRSAYLTVERSGRGLIVLFHSVPGYRGYVRSTARLFGNAVLYGPGAGADAPVDWRR